MPSDVVRRVEGWVPLAMPEPLLQARYFPDVWKICVTCIFLNCTTRRATEPIIETFFERYPNPDALLATPDAEVSTLVAPLGFKNRRTQRLKRFSEEYLTRKWSDVRELHGIGEYAAQCVEMLVYGVFRSSPPPDHALKDYWEFCKREGVF